MTKYKSVYTFNLFDTIRKGKKVYALDKRLVETFSVHTMEVEDFATLLDRAEKDKERYDFWTIIEEEVEDVEII